MSWADDHHHDCHGQISPTPKSTTLRHLFERVVRKFSRTSPSTPTSPILIDHNPAQQKSKRKSFLARRRSSWHPPHHHPNPQSLQNGLQNSRENENENGIHIQNHFHFQQPTSPHHPHRSSLSFLSSRRRSTSFPLPYTATPKPNYWELTPFPVLPVELVCAILVEAAHDHVSARRLVLVNRQVKYQVEKVLYANVHLGDMAAIRLFARTVREASAVPRLPRLRLPLGLGTPGVGVGVEIGRAGAGAGAGASAGAGGGGREAARERFLDDLREEEEGSSTVVPPPSHMALIEKPTAVRTKLRRLSRRLSQPPPPAPSSSSSTLPTPPSPSSSFAPPSPTAIVTTGHTTAAGAAGAEAETAAPTGSTLTRAFFATAVRALTLVVQEDHFRILYPDVLDCARLILCTCDAVRELEISGDLIRRTDPASISMVALPVPMTASAPVSVPASSALMAPGVGIGPPVLPPIPNVTLNDSGLLPSTSGSALIPPIPPTSTAAISTLQTDLYAARMRPTHLTLLAPHNNVNFHLPMLQHVTHLRYAICPPRILGWQSCNDGSASIISAPGIHAAGGHTLAQQMSAAAMPNNSHHASAAVGAGGIGTTTTTTGRGRLLRRLTHVAFDYQIGREGGHGGMGIGVWGAGNFVGIVREALAAGGGGSPAVPLPLPFNGGDGGSPLAPHAEDGEGEGNVQTLGLGSGSGSGSGYAQAQAQARAEGAGEGEGAVDGDAGALESLGELGRGEVPPLERVVVKIILRPRAEMLSKFNAIWPRLDAVRKADPRLVYFGAKWRDNEMFGENLWERVRSVEERRDAERERVRVRQRSNSAASSGTAGGGGGRRRRASSVSIGWFQDG